LAIVCAYSDATEQAVRAAEDAVEISPSFALGYFVLGVSRLFSGDPAAASAAFERGLRLNPYDPQNFVWTYLLALSFYFAGQTDKALQAAIRASGIRPGWPPGIEALALCYITLGRMDDARACVKQLRELEKPKRDIIAPLKRRNPQWTEKMAAMLRKAEWEP
jgi:tetratricopeptide (TPR) repeat protein